jgi:ribosomal protein S18 acetylase RimI-like enzyme
MNGNKPIILGRDKIQIAIHHPQPEAANTSIPALKMEGDKMNNLQIINTTRADLDTILWLFEQAMQLQGKNGYKVWNAIDRIALEKDIDKKLQYKIVRDNTILCIFSIQYNDPFIWRSRDRNDAIYLHRIVVHPGFKGQKQFEKVLTWAVQFARQNNLQFIRMDTWADNEKIIDYYKSFGFQFVENYKTTDAPELPVQNRDLNVALLEMPVSEEKAGTDYKKTVTA